MKIYCLCIANGIIHRIIKYISWQELRKLPIDIYSNDRFVGKNGKNRIFSKYLYSSCQIRKADIKRE